VQLSELEGNHSIWWPFKNQIKLKLM